MIEGDGFGTFFMNSKIKILHLEDSLKDSELIHSILENGGILHEYLLADNEKDFLDILEKENIDIILADYGLPNYNGDEALRVAKDKYSHIPFIFVSGTIGEDAAINLMVNGAKDYVLKSKLGRLVPAVIRALHEKELEVLDNLADENLKNSEEIFRSLAEYSSDMILIIIKNKIHYVNQLCEIKLGYTKEEFYAADFDFGMLNTHENNEELKNNLILNLAGKQVEPYDFLITAKDGRQLYTIVNTRSIRIGKENAILGIIIDISEQRWADKILMQQANQVDHFNSLMVDRELKMVELKQEINSLLEKQGESSKYKV
jgi:PAS domain S-box-containing protein